MGHSCQYLADAFSVNCGCKDTTFFYYTTIFCIFFSKYFQHAYWQALEKSKKATFKPYNYKGKHQKLFLQGLKTPSQRKDVVF